MNILFFTRDFKGGGVATVTVFLANLFAREGHCVRIAAFDRMSPAFHLADGITVTTLEPPSLRPRNIRTLRRLLSGGEIDFVINQIGHVASYCLLLNIAAASGPVKTIAVLHNQPGGNPHLSAINLKLRVSRSLCERLALTIKAGVIHAIYSVNMWFVYLHSSRYVLLSQEFIPLFRRFIHYGDMSKIRGIPNPVTLLPRKASLEKENLLLFVGRFQFEQKHVERVVMVWEILSAVFADWRLCIVGDGPERESLEKLCAERGLERITFEGYRDPAPFYEAARILLLTSEYEGFPLVVTEAMSFGVIPVAYNSFVSLKDIVTHNKTGLVIDPDPETRAFSREKMTKELSALMRNKDRLATLSKNARDDSRRYNADTVCRRWVEVFDSFDMRNKT